MGLGSVVSGAAKIGSGALKSVSSALSGSSNWLPLFGSVVSSGLGLAGGLYAANKSAQVASNINLLNYKQAKEFAQNQIQWRVNDAKAAGLHPLVALGITPQAAPASAVGGDMSGLGNALGDMGQNISRAVDAYQTRDDRLREQEKAEALQALQYRLQLERFNLDSRESASRTALNDARTKVEQQQLINMVKASSVMGQPRVPARPKVNNKKTQGDMPVIEGNMNGYLYNSDRDTYVPFPSKARAEMSQNLGWLGHAYDSILHAGSRISEVLGLSSRKPFVARGHLYVYNKWDGEYHRTLPVRR